MAILPISDDDKTANPILKYLRRFEQRQTVMHEELILIRDRLASLESRVSLMRNDLVRVEHRLDPPDCWRSE